MNNNLNIEKAVLSSIFFDYENIYIAKESLTPKDFYFPAYQKIYSAMLKLHSEDMPIDEDFLRKKLDSKDVDDSVILDIFTANPITNIKAYVKDIKDASVKRELVSLATTIKKVVIEDGISSVEAIVTVENELYKITDSSKSYKSRGISEIVDSYKEKHKEASTPKGRDKLITTGITAYDSKFDGFDEGTLVVLGARPSMGKSSLAFQSALHNVKRKKGVVVDSLEMSSEQVILRFVANENQESISDLKKGLVSNFKKFNETLNFLSNNKYLHIDDKPLTFNQLKTKFLRIKRARDKADLPTNLWIIDHIGYVTLLGKIQKRDELSAGSKMLKALAKELGITIILLSQLNRAVTDRKGLSKNRPQMSDLKDSGSLEEDADYVVLPHRDSYYEAKDKNVVENPTNDAIIILDKNRDGPIGAVKTQFKGPTTTFGCFPTVEVLYQTKSAADTRIEDISMEADDNNQSVCSIFM